jgi:argininosuccinate synthase
MERIVLAYSGHGDAASAIAAVAREHDAEVVTLTVDLGQGRDLDDARRRALAGGAARAHVVDAREMFAREVLLPALQAGAVDEGRLPMARPLARSIIARQLVEVAHIEGASAVAHSGAAESAACLVALMHALDPALQVVAVPSTAAAFVSTNLWGRTVTLDAQDVTVSADIDPYCLLTRSAEDAPDDAAHVEIGFDRGVPVSVNDVPMPLVELLESLETIAGAHGVGRFEAARSQRGGAIREIVEAPAAWVLQTAHDELQRFVSTRDVGRLSAEAALKYGDLVHRGEWFSPARDALDALVTTVQQRVTGTIRLKLFKADCRVVATASPFAASASPSRKPRAAMRKAQSLERLS